MQTYQREFIELAIEHEVLRFGSFTLKSGRTSPYFFNAGLFNTGGLLASLGRFYAAAIVDSDVEFDVMLGPAYKGIPIVSATAIALGEHFGRDVPWSFNRKEVKDHGEGGLIVGSPLTGRVLIVDDVITAGTAIGEVMKVVHASEAQAVAVMVVLDRQERGAGELSAIGEVKRTYDVDVRSIVTLDHIIEYLEETGRSSESLAAVRDYRAEYGVTAS